MTDIYAPCLCGSGKKFKFCCRNGNSKREVVNPITSELSKFHVYECKVLENWEQSGIGPVFVSRQLSKDSYVCISYMVDFWCLGVKDAIVKYGISKEELHFFVTRFEGLKPISYQMARSLILGVVDFAKGIGIAPHSSWNGLPSLCVESHLAYEKKFTFGQKGKPYYFSGPYDHENYDEDEIIQKVQDAGGEYTLVLS